jgi:hypothetical protein
MEVKVASDDQEKFFLLNAGTYNAHEILFPFAVPAQLLAVRFMRRPMLSLVVSAAVQDHLATSTFLQPKLGS